MKTLVITPTYGRIPFLNRTLASFLSQDYDDKHLVIINDDKNVQICCEYKNVTCINISNKILVGQKRNIGVMCGFYDIYLPLDDDDVFLPTRISANVLMHKNNPDVGLLMNGFSYIVYGSDFNISRSAPSSMSFTKQGWFNVGGYMLNSNKGEDQEFINKFKNKLVYDDENSADYVYNYGGLNYHLSHASDNDIEKIAYDQLISMGLLGKKYFIEPDYDEFNKFIELDKLYKAKKEVIKVKHVSFGKIEIL